jgi:hypothetical protein
MWKRVSSMVLILVVVAGAVGAAGEEPPDPRASAAFVGDRVRLRMTGERDLLTGKVLEIDGAALVLARGREGGVPGPLGSDGVLRVPLASLERLEVVRGRRNRAGMGAAIGFVPGALFGGTVGLYIACSEQVGCSPVGPVLVGGLLGGAATGALGALIGLAIRTDRWQAIPLGDSAAGRKATVGIGLSPVSGRGFQVGLSVGF